MKWQFLFFHLENKLQKAEGPGLNYFFKKRKGGMKGGNKKKE